MDANTVNTTKAGLQLKQNTIRERSSRPEEDPKEDLKADPDAYRARICRAFSGSADSYARHARIQAESAQRLVELIEEQAEQIRGPVLELGCGTGLVSRPLARLFTGRELHFTDLSPDMLERCRRTVLGGDGGGACEQRDDRARNDEQESHLHWFAIDAELASGLAPYGLIVSGMTLQWFSDPAGFIRRICTRELGQGAWLAFSMPVSGSFSHWQNACRELGLAFNGNTLPEPVTEAVLDGTGAQLVTRHMETRYQYCRNARDFFNGLKRIGAHASRGKRPRLGAGGFRSLLQAMDRRAGVSGLAMDYRIQYVVVRK